MSIKVMTRVWEHAEYKESTLLILLALADFADDNGLCWPEVPTLAAKARVSDRRAIDIIQALEKDGAIVYRRGGGRGRRSLYGVLVGLTDEQKERVKLFHRNYFSENKTVKPGAIKGELQRKERVNYSVNSRKGLEQQDAPSPDPIRHVDPSLDPSVGESAKKDTAKPSKLDDLARALFNLCLIDSDSASKADLAAMRKTYRGLADKNISAEQVCGHFSEYWYSDSNWRTRKAHEGNYTPEPPKPDQVLTEWPKAMAWKPAKKKGSGPLTTTKPTAAPDAQPSQESASKMLELIAQQRGKT